MFVFNNHGLANTICVKVGVPYNPNVDHSIVRVENDKLLGGIVYQEYTGNNGSVVMHIASWSPRWVSRDFLWLAFDYPFNQMKVRKIIGLLSEWNYHALQFDLKAGFKFEHRVKDVYPDGDMIMLGMYREDCKYLALKPRLIHRTEASDGQEVRATAA